MAADCRSIWSWFDSFEPSYPKNQNEPQTAALINFDHGYSSRHGAV